MENNGTQQSTAEREAEKKVRRYTIASIVMGCLILVGVVAAAFVINGFTKKYERAKAMNVGLCRAFEILSDTSVARFERRGSNTRMRVYPVENGAVEMQYLSNGSSVVILQVGREGSISSVDWEDPFHSKPVVSHSNTYWEEMLAE
jgi:hypothetical protein